MNRRTVLALVLVASSLSSLPARAAEDAYVFKTLLYVLKNDGAHKFVVESGGGIKVTKGREGHWLSFQSPVTIRFDQETLRLQGDTLVWSDEAVMAKKISLLTMPTIVTPAGKPATMFIGGSTQYFEKLPDGNFRLDELPKDSSASPHCAITLLAEPGESATGILSVTFTADITAVAARDKIPGVELDVGKPVLVTFKDKLKFTAARDAWTALCYEAPSGSDYSLLLLLKVSQQDATAERAGQKLVPAGPAPSAGTP